MIRIICSRKSGKFTAVLASLETIPNSIVLVPNQKAKKKYPKKFHHRIFTPEEFRMKHEMNEEKDFQLVDITTYDSNKNYKPERTITIRKK